MCVIALGAATFAFLVPRAELAPYVPLLFLVLLSSLTSAFKVQFPIASGSNMSVSYVVDIAALMLRGPHAAMLVGAAGAWSQTTLNSRTPNPLFRTLFNMAILVLTVQASGQVFQRLGGTPTADASALVMPLAGMALTYFFANTIPIAIAIALTTNQNAWRIWKSDFASSAPSYLLGAVAAAVVIKVTDRSGYWLTLLLTAAPLYLTYKMYRAGLASEARQGAILEAARDAIIAMDHDSRSGSSIRRPSRCSATSGSTSSDGAPSCCCRRRTVRRRWTRSGSICPPAVDRSPGGRSKCAASNPTAPTSRSS